MSNHEEIGKGVGLCPRPLRSGACGCGLPKCSVCGYPKHSAVHMYCLGGKSGDPPYGHEYKPAPALADCEGVK